MTRRFALAIVFASLAIPAAAAGPASTLRLEKLSVADPMVGGDEAFSLLVPRGWRHEGGVLWQQQYSNLATGRFRVFDPAGATQLEVFPVTPCVWADQGIAFFPPGSVYLGNEVAPPPRSAHDYVRDDVIPRFRESARSLRISGRARLEDVERALSQGGEAYGLRTTVLAERVRIEYQDAVTGRAMEEDVYCALTLSTTPSMPGTTIWSPERLYAFRAEKGRLDADAPLLQAMASSMRLSLGWFAKYSQVLEMARNNQLQSIRDAGEISRRVSRNNDEILAMYRQSWQERQASADRVNREFGEAIRGVESYVDPAKDFPVELPSGYRNAWVSGSGEYVLSNEDGFDPNVGSTIGWKRMEAAK